jgi:hypothetical protein
VALNTIKQAYCSWIYNYLGKQVPITTNLWDRIPLRRGVLDTTLCDKVCQWLATGRSFSPGTLVSSTNKTNRHDITDILLKVVLNTMPQTLISSNNLEVHMSLNRSPDKELFYWTIAYSIAVMCLFKHLKSHNSMPKLYYSSGFRSVRLLVIFRIVWFNRYIFIFEIYSKYCFIIKTNVLSSRI